MTSFPVPLAPRHTRTQPSLGVLDRLWIRWWGRAFVDAPMPGKRVCSREEPGLVLGLGQNDAYGTIRPALLGAPQQCASEIRRTVVIRVQQHKNAPIRSG